MAKDDTPIRKRLHEWMALYKEVSRFDGEYDFREIADRRLRGYQAKVSSLDTAAEFFGFKLSHQDDSELLLRILADIAFGARPKGRRKGAGKWNSASLFILGFHDDLVRRKNPEMSDNEISKLVKNAHSKTYSDTTAGAIRTQLPVARNTYVWVKAGPLRARNSTAE